MKKNTIYVCILVLLIIVVIVATILLKKVSAPTIDESGIYTGVSTSTSESKSSNAPFSNSDEEGYSRYDNSKFGFSIMYPTSINIISSTSAGDRDGMDSDGTFTAKIPDDAFAGSNLREVTIIAGGKKTDQTTCSTKVYDTDMKAYGGNSSTQTTINGINFTKIKVSDAGAGNIYETTRYSTYRKGNCYEVLAVAHSTNLGILQESQPDIKQYDESLYMPEFTEIVNSFHFLAS